MVFQRKFNFHPIHDSSFQLVQVPSDVMGQSAEPKFTWLKQNSSYTNKAEIHLPFWGKRLDVQCNNKAEILLPSGGAIGSEADN